MATYTDRVVETDDAEGKVLLSASRVYDRTEQKAQDEINADLKNSLNTFVRPNLLDNWWFGNPVNQRGKSSYAGAGYTIDRWKNNQDAVTTTYNSTDGYISVVRSSSQWNSLIQFIENWKDLAGKKVTISILLHSAYTADQNCNIRLCSSDTETNYGHIRVYGNDKLFSTTITLPSNISSLAFSFYVCTTALNIKAAKLELGEGQTLAHYDGTNWVLNEIPDYETELLKCQTSKADGSDTYANQVVSTNAPRPNLLDNWYFVGGGSQRGGGQFPINQRGQTSYSNTGYSVDRWKNAGNVLSVSFPNTNDYIILSNASSGHAYYVQAAESGLISSLSGETITLSCLMADGTLYSGSGVANQSFEVSTSFGALYSFRNSNSELFVLRITSGKTANIKAAKLELGSSQTLAHLEGSTWVLNEIPDYDEQMMRCCSSKADSADTYANKPYNDLKNSIDALSNITGNYYCKMPDGTLICWGEKTGANNAQVDFPVSFANTNYSVTLSGRYNAATTIKCIFSVNDRAKTYFKVEAWDANTKADSTATNLVFFWQAIGRWK